MNSQVNGQKRFYIHTLGCKVNQYESEAMREILLASDFKECLSKEIADIYIINTCTVTHHADSESRYCIGLFHRTNPKAKIIVTGCFVEKDAHEISFLPGIAHIVKNEDKNRIAEIIDGRKTSNTRPPVIVSGFKGHTKAFVKIQDGCENACSYCKVPIVRNRLWSRPVDEVRREVSALVKNGYKEIVLTGICLGAWELGNLGLLDVLKTLDKVDGDFRIRLSSIEPQYVTDDLIAFLAENKRMCRHLHIPLQSGDADILKKMNRRYAPGDYKSLLGKIRRAIPGIAITTDVLIGFPGEADVNFKNTVNFIKEILPLRTHIFTFSRRKGTAAYDQGYEMKGDLLKKRYWQLNVAAFGASYLYRSAFLERVLNVLVETKRDRKTGLLSGYTDNYIRMLFEGSDELMRKLVPVKIADVNLLNTYGAYAG